MDLNSLVSTLLSEESIDGLGARAGATPEEVRGVLGNALPMLLGGANAQAANQDTASGFVGALQQHAQDDTSNLSSFLGNVDLSDGAKIIAHLLGANTAAQTQTVAQQAGVSQQQAGSILSAAAPLLLSLLGQQTASAASQNNSAGIGGLMGSLMGSGDMTSLLGGLLGGGGAAQQPLQQISEPAAQTQQNAAKPSGLLGKLFGRYLSGISDYLSLIQIFTFRADDLG